MMKIKIMSFLSMFMLANVVAECTTTPAPQEGYCKNTRIIRAVGINERTYFYRAHPLYKYAIAASHQGSSLASELWDRVEGICGLLYDYDPNNPSTHPFSKGVWKIALQNCRAERKNPPTTINFAGENEVIDVCWSASPARLAFEADWNYLQSRLDCFQQVTKNCSDPNSPQCKQAIDKCQLDETVCDICFAGNPESKPIVKQSLKHGAPPRVLELDEEGICYSYCSSILQPINLRELVKINVSAYKQVPYLQISNDGVSFCNVTNI